MQIFCLPFQFCRGEDGVTPGPNSKSSPSQMWGDNHSSSHWQHNSKVPVRTRPWTEEGGRTPEYLEGTRKEVGRTQTSSTESNPNHCLSKTSCQSLKEKTEKKRCLNYQWIFFFAWQIPQLRLLRLFCCHIAAWSVITLYRFDGAKAQKADKSHQGSTCHDFTIQQTSDFSITTSNLHVFSLCLAAAEDLSSTEGVAIFTAVAVNKNKNQPIYQSNSIKTESEVNYRQF